MATNNIVLVTLWWERTIQLISALRNLSGQGRVKRLLLWFYFATDLIQAWVQKRYVVKKLLLVMGNGTLYLQEGIEEMEWSRWLIFTQVHNLSISQWCRLSKKAKSMISPITYIPDFTFYLRRRQTAFGTKFSEKMTSRGFSRNLWGKIKKNVCLY